MNLFLRTAACGLGLLLAACAPSSYVVKKPVPSTIKFAQSATASTVNLQVVDKRAATEVFNTGTLQATLKLDGAPLSATPFFISQLQAELNSRGVNAKVDSALVSEQQIELNSFRMLNHRTNGYTPYITFTFLKADVTTPKGKKRIAVFVKRAKVPVWGFEELIEPTMNQPLSIAVKEFAAKLAAELDGSAVADNEVEKLIATARTAKGDNAFLDVYALGFSNNKKAIPALIELLKSPDEYIRLAAISSLGTLRATDSMTTLQAIYREGKMWQDRAMALKAIGDFDTAESKAFLMAEKAKLSTLQDKQEAGWFAAVYDLYI